MFIIGLSLLGFGTFGHNGSPILEILPNNCTINNAITEV